MSDYIGFSDNDLLRLKLNNGKTIKQEMKSQAEYLKELIEKYMRDYRKAFKPKRYRRTGNLLKSVSVHSNIKVVGGKPTAYVYFDKNAVHRSGFGSWAVKDGRGKYDDDINSFDSDKSINVAELINDGYVVHKPVWFKNYKNFGYRRGNGFIDKAITEFNRTNTLGIVISPRDVIICDDSPWTE